MKRRPFLKQKKRIYKIYTALIFFDSFLFFVLNFFILKISKNNYVFE